MSDVSIYVKEVCPMCASANEYDIPLFGKDDVVDQV